MRIKGYDYARLAEDYKKHYGYDKSWQNLSKKIRSGTIKYVEYLQLLDVMGYKVKIEEK
jgi:hypothetical protein